MNNKKLDNVLLIDDDEVANFIYEKIIDKSGITNNVEAKTSGKDALAYLDKRIDDGHPLPNVIFLDINMPIMSGWEFLREYEKLTFNKEEKCAIYMLSSSVYKEDLEKAKSYDIVEDYVTKPLTEETLIKIRDRHFEANQ